MRGASIAVAARPRGRWRGWLGLRFIHVGIWLCGAYHIDVSVNGKHIKTMRPKADVTVSVVDE